MALERHGPSICAAADERDEASVIRASEGSVDPLPAAAVDNDIAGVCVDDRDVKTPTERRCFAPKRLNGDLEVNDCRRRKSGAGDRSGVRDHPLFCVGRDVGRRLVHLAGVKRKRRREEGMDALVRGKVPELRSDTTDVARVLWPGTIDEAGLADARWVELLEVGERRLRLAKRRPASLDFAQPGAGRRVEIPEGWIMRSN